MYIIIFLFFLLNILGFIYKSSKLLAIIIFLFAWLLIVGNFENPDIENYIWRYEASDTWSGAFVYTNTIEPGYALLNYLGNYLGLSFMAFKQVLSVFSFILIASFIFRVGANFALILACYLMSFFLIDVIQIRNFFAMSVLLFGLKYLLKPNINKLDLLKYIICSLVATSIHISLAFSLLFVFARYTIKWWYIVALIISYLVYKSILFNTVAVSLDSEKVDMYVGKSSVLGGVYGAIVIVANFVFIALVEKNASLALDNSTSTLFPDFRTTKNLNLILFLIIPLLFESGIFSRILKDLLIVNYAYLSLHLKGQKLVFLILYALFFFGFYILGDSSKLIIESVLKYNLFFTL